MSEAKSAQLFRAGLIRLRRIRAAPPSGVCGLMVTEIVLPDLGQISDEMTLLSWRKAEGDSVSSGEILFEVETDKTVVEVEATAGGVLRRILIPEGEKIPALTVVGLIAEPTEELPEMDPFYRTARAEKASAPVSAPGAEPPPGETGLPSRPTRLASPRARRLAAELGIDLGRVQGTGAGGRIEEADVRRALEAQATAPSGEPTAAPSRAVSLSRMRQAIALRMSESWREIPHFHLETTIRLDRLEAERAKASPSPSYTDFFIQAAAASLAEVPELNAKFLGDLIEVCGEVNIGLVVATDDGLVIPVIHNADRLTLEEIGRVRQELVTAARERQLRASDLSGATFTLSNLGAEGVEAFTALIYPPQVAVLSIGSVHRAPEEVEGGVRFGPVVRATLGCDHRAVDGVLGAHFLRAFARHLETGT